MAVKTHAAVMTVAVRVPLEVHQVPTIPPVNDEVLVRAEWTASTPLDLHQVDGGLLVKHPQVVGDSVAGTVLEVGPEVKSLEVGDKVFGFQWREQKEKGHQEKVIAPEWLFAKIPKGFSMQEAITVPNNFVTACHTITTDLGFPLPWPKPNGYAPPKASEPILIWGASSSVGQYVLQVLRYYGYRSLPVTASPSQHGHLQKLGASKCFSYRNADVVEEIQREYPTISHIIDCIGSKTGTLEPISRIASRGTRVAVMLPVIIKAASKDHAPEYGLEVQPHAKWAEGVEVRGVRTHFYLQNHEYKERLQSEIMPTMMEEGMIVPNRYRLVEGKTLLERAEKALDILRSGTISGERLVWRISDS